MDGRAWQEGLKAINVRGFQERLDRLADSLENFIDREWVKSQPSRSDYVLVLETNLKLARHYYRTVCFLAATSESPVAGWVNEHSLVLPLISRATLEILFNTIFLLEDFPVRAKIFLQSGWRDSKLHYQRFYEEYGDRPEARWQNWFITAERLLALGEQRYEISEEQKANPYGIKMWPKFGQMPRYGIASDTPSSSLPDQRRLLDHLYLWHYSDLSAECHQNGFGHLRLGGLTMSRSMPREQRDQLQDETFPKHISNHYIKTATFALAIVCEIQQFVSYKENLAEPFLTDIWHQLAKAEDASDIFEIRYKAFYNFPIIGK